MEIVELPVGQPADIDKDCIRIEEQDAGGFRLTASALCNDGDADDSVSIVGAPTYSTIAAARAAGVSWATTVGVERLFVSVGTLARPLARTEMDKPL